jgi:adenosylmethionine-8-amino-7-oxononanoate aminotransferase
MPLAVVMTGQQIYDAFYDDYQSLKAFLHSHSYSGNPLACAVACEVLKIFQDEQILAKLTPKMALLDANASRFENLAHVGEFRRCGMVAAIEMVKDKNEKTPYPWQERRGYEVYKKALEKGALLRPLGNVIYFMPALNIEEPLLQELLDVAFESVLAVCGT